MESDTVVFIFDRLFHARYKTHLISGAEEPYYLFDPEGYSKIYFRSNYISSALHEVAHWCIAGAKRRRENDYGYFYISDRSREQQLHFQRFERKAQALEWVFSVAARVPFEVSIDNFNHNDRIPFAKEVRVSAMALLAKGLTVRALAFANALSAEVGGGQFLSSKNYNLIPGR